MSENAVHLNEVNRQPITPSHQLLDKAFVKQLRWLLKDQNRCAWRGCKENGPKCSISMWIPGGGKVSLSICAEHIHYSSRPRSWEVYNSEWEVIQAVLEDLEDGAKHVLYDRIWQIQSCTFAPLNMDGGHERLCWGFTNDYDDRMEILVCPRGECQKLLDRWKGLPPNKHIDFAYETIEHALAKKDEINVIRSNNSIRKLNKWLSKYKMCAVLNCPSESSTDPKSYILPFLKESSNVNTVKGYHKFQVCNDRKGKTLGSYQSMG